MVWSTCDVRGSSQREDQRSVQLLWLGRQHSFRVIEETCELRLNLWTPQSRDQPQSGALDAAHTNTQIEYRLSALLKSCICVKWIKQHMHLTEAQSAFNGRLIS